MYLFLRFRSCRGLWKDPLDNRPTFLLLRPRGREYKPYELQWNVSRASIRLTYTCWVTFGMCLFLMFCISACVFFVMLPYWLVSFPLPHSLHMACVFFFCQFLMNFSKKDTCYCTRQNILLPLHSILVHSIFGINTNPRKNCDSWSNAMNKVRITAIRQTVYQDLIDQYENPIEHACTIRQGQQWISIDGKCPDGLCPSAWESMQSFVDSLARGKGNFFDGWMKNPMSAMISCNDGFRPFSFYIEVIGEQKPGTSSR